MFTTSFCSIRLSVFTTLFHQIIWVLSLSGLREFKLSELEAATNNFSHNNIIGRGAHSIAYKVYVSEQIYGDINFLECELRYWTSYDFFYYCMIVLLCSFNDVFIVEFSCGEWGLFRKMLIILLKNTIHDDQIEISLLVVWSLVFMSWHFN